MLKALHVSETDLDLSRHDDDIVLGKFESDYDGNAAAAATTTLPDFWWRVLNVSTEDIPNLMDALLGVCAWKGLENVCQMRLF